MNQITKTLRGLEKFNSRGVSLQTTRPTAQLSVTQTNEPPIISLEKLKLQLQNGLQQLFGKTPELKTESRVKSYGEMAGPKGLPFFGSALDYTFLGPYSPKEYTIALKDRHEKFGKTFKEKIMNEEFVYISDPKDVAVLVRNEGKFPCRPNLEALTESRLQQGLPVGVTNMQGEEWYKNRSAANPILMRPKSVLQARKGQREVTRELIKYMREVIGGGSGEVEDFEFVLNKWALESVAVILLDMRLGLFKKGENKVKRSARKLQHCMDVFFDYGARLTFSAPTWKLFETQDWKILKKSQRDEFKYAGEIVDERLAELEKEGKVPKESKCPFSSKKPANKCPMKKPAKPANNLLEHVVANGLLSRKDAVTLNLEMLAGGIDTTSTCSVFILYQLAENQEYQEKLRRLAMETKEGDPKETKDEFVRWMRAVSYEAMRLNPLTYANSRTTEQDLVLGGFQVPAGTTVRFTSHLMNLKDPKYFPEPEKFIPERWLDKNSPFACKEQFVFTPFGHGARQCPGRRVAQQEIEILFREILTNFQVDYHHQPITTKVRLFNKASCPPRFKFTELK